MAKARKESALERRLRELEDESRYLRENMHAVSKSLSKLDVDPHTVAAVASSRSAIASTPPVQQRSAATLHPEAETSMPAQVAQSSDALSAAVPPPPELSRAMGWKPPASSLRRAPDPQRFATYFSNGSFVDSRPVGKQRHQMRNRAIFMIIVVLIVAFVMISKLF